MEYMPDPDYVSRHVQINWKTRANLINWLIRVHAYLRLQLKTLYFAVNTIDRYLSVQPVNPVSWSQFDLIGYTGLLLAAKHGEGEEKGEKTLKFIELFFTTDKVEKAENYILKKLCYCLAYPGPTSFLSRISKADNYDTRIQTVAKYFMEVTLMDHRCIPCPPSMIAATCCYFALKLFGDGDWVSVLR
jgi:G2/mitotic-specific cyclin 2